MTQKDPGNDFNPMHRVLGAVILVAAAVIVIPLVLSERELPSAAVAPVASAGGDRPPQQMKVAVTDLRQTVREPPPREESMPAVETPPVPTIEPAKQAPATTSSDTSSAPTAIRAPAPVEAPARLDRGWVVQVGTFANVSNAERLEAKLRELGHAVRNERITLDSGRAVRLRVGPFRDRALALKAQAQIQKEIGVQGVVLAFP